MGQSLSTTFRRHRKKLLFVGGVVGSIAFLNTYMRRKLVEWEQQKTIEYIEQLKKQSHFDGTLQTCDQAIISFLPTVRTIILETIDVSPIVENLKSKPPNKIELWNELKIMVFTEIVAEMYSQCLLVILLRVQLSILGGYVYANFQKNKNADANKASQNQQKYLSHISSFLNGGIKDLIIPVEDAVRKSFKGITLADCVKLEDFHKLFRRITDNMSRGHSGVAPNIAQYMMLSDSNQNENAGYDEFLDKIICETKDVLECHDFDKVFKCCLELGIAMLMDRISECYMHLGNDKENFSNPNSHALPLAKIIPIVHTVFENHKPNEQGSLIYILLQQETLKTFTANLYEAFSQNAS